MRARSTKEWIFAVVAALAALAFVAFVVQWIQGRREKRRGDVFRASTFRPMTPASNVPRSSGCGRVARTAKNGDDVVLGDRSYLAFAPAEYDASRAYPIVVVFHGWHTDARHFASWFTMERFVDDAAIVVYPNAGSDTNGTWDVSGASDLTFVGNVIHDVEASYCVDTSRVLAFGFSYGAKLAYHVGCRAPDLLKAVAVGDGSMGGPEEGCGTIPLLASHRPIDGDEVFAWGTGAFDTWAKQSGCASESDVVDEVHGCATRRGCRRPATFCQDDFVNPSWPADWNHTIRGEYRALTWKWFESLP